MKKINTYVYTLFIARKKWIAALDFFDQNKAK